MKASLPSILEECRKLSTEADNLRVGLAEQAAQIEIELRAGEQKTIAEKIEGELFEKPKLFKMCAASRARLARERANQIRQNTAALQTVACAYKESVNEHLVEGARFDAIERADSESLDRTLGTKQQGATKDQTPGKTLGDVGERDKGSASKLNHQAMRTPGQAN